MREELNELGDEYIERSVESIAVQLVVAILTDLVESREGSLHMAEWSERCGRRERGSPHTRCSLDRQ